MARTRKGLDKFSVMLAGKSIDVLYIGAEQNMTAEELRRSLISHDGYDAAISVRCTERAKPSKWSPSCE